MCGRGVRTGTKVGTCHSVQYLELVGGLGLVDRLEHLGAQAHVLNVGVASLLDIVGKLLTHVVVGALGRGRGGTQVPERKRVSERE